MRKVLLDENVDYDFKYLLVGHDVWHVDDQGWKGLSNGKLLDACEAEGFEVLVTGDAKLQFQQNVAVRSLALAVLAFHPKSLANLSACVPNLMKALATLQPGKVYLIELPQPDMA